jgi:hypothetical protein
MVAHQKLLLICCYPQRIKKNKKNILFMVGERSFAQNFQGSFLLPPLWIAELSTMTTYSYPGNLRAITAGSCTYVLQRGSNPSTPATATATAASSDDSEWWKQERCRRDFEQNGRSGKLWTCATDGSSNACPESELAAREEWYHHQC